MTTKNDKSGLVPRHDTTAVSRTDMISHNMPGRDMRHDMT